MRRRIWIDEERHCESGLVLLQIMRDYMQHDNDVPNGGRMGRDVWRGWELSLTAA